MNPAEVIEHVMQRDRVGMVLNLFRESVGQSRETPHAHPHGQVLPFDVASRNKFFDRVSSYPLLFTANTFGRAVSRFVFLVARLAVNLRHALPERKMERRWTPSSGLHDP